MWGDTAFEAPFRTLGKIDQGPYFAVKMEAGGLGTAGGRKTNAEAQVIDWSGNPIPGFTLRATRWRRCWATSTAERAAH
ncbi:FAD-binding protein [Novosphingobium resinovorum]|jgi:predicted oxidoreductase|uniref:FAD-dependent oxidoreductase 2 FAD-binding domain-containing protein n=1 Tax=Novosphingobium resinovorum TaxID=158500 RepID=A0A1D8A0W1_9SPHN|nr:MULTISPECIES: FAD-binding protein [Sphingomonadaceae]AOR75748.1 hypothetical protein BES08_02530 [Novosphingobium resinovorum]EJU09929.1 fumarate reductase/succinate dehydrogenase flavoprotein-like protein [Sphingomonas sp. LH128]WJM29090.1 FAD-binding protein [Novosphingobium resinovorum]